MRAQEFITESNNTAVMAKLADSGKIVRILKKVHSVQFSDKKDWLLIDTDPARGHRGLGAKWIPANTKFEWVRPYLEKIDESVDAKKIVSYIKKIQGDGHFHMDNLVTRYPSWRLIQMPLSKLTINPDPEKKNPLGTNINVDLDYVQDITPHDIANRPIVVDPSGWIIDGNHRATRAEELGMTSIPAYVPVKQDVTESPSVAQEIKEFINSLTPDDVGVEEFPGYRVHYEGFTDDCKSSLDYQQDPDAVYQQVYQDFVDREHGQKPVKSGMAGSEEYPVLYSVFRVEQGVAEAFDQPYKGKWEKSDYGDVDMLAKLPDGTNLSIMFNQEYGDEGEEVVQVEFYRNNSQDVTGEGDAQRIFATVLDAIQKYIKKYKPQRLSFSASKEVDMDADDNGAQFNPESRAKLYDRLVQRYSKALGYRAFRADNGDIVIYELSRIKQGVAEEGYGNHPSQRVDPRTGKRYVPPKSPLGQGVAENFADGRGPGRPGDSQRHGIRKGATMAELEKASHAKGRKGQLARWQLNMRRGHKK